MNTYIKKLFETIEFNNSNIFNTEDSYYEYDEKDSLIYRTIENKIQNDKLISEEESIFYFKQVHEIPKNILNKLLNAETGINEIIKGLLENNIKYKVKNKLELRKIIKIYSEKNPTSTLNWIDTSEITDMSELFEKTNYNGDISQWDVSNVTNMSRMFQNAILFNQFIGNWNVSQVTNMAFMFWNAVKFNQHIGDWNVGKVSDMAYMFAEAKSFNKPIGNWNVSNVTNMAYIFQNAKSFNQPIENWNINNVRNIWHMFKNCPIEEEYKPKI